MFLLLVTSKSKAATPSLDLHSFRPPLFWISHLGTPVLGTFIPFSLQSDPSADDPYHARPCRRVMDLVVAGVPGLCLSLVSSYRPWKMQSLIFYSTSRVMHQGSFKELQVDDWLMCFALATYTVVIVALNIVSNSNSNLFPPGYDYSTLTTTDISEREYGSKLVLVVVCEIRPRRQVTLISVDRSKCSVQQSGWPKLAS